MYIPAIIAIVPCPELIFELQKEMVVRTWMEVGIGFVPWPIDWNMDEYKVKGE